MGRVAGWTVAEGGTARALNSPWGHHVGDRAQSRAREGAVDDRPLRAQPFHPRLEQALAELVEVKKTKQQREHPGKVEHDDPAREARGGAQRQAPAQPSEPGKKTAPAAP